jgi:agmatine deiminase
MFFEKNTDTVFVADGLRRYPAVHNSIREHLRIAGVSVVELERVKNIWARDFMPVQIIPGTFVKFRYKGDVGKYSKYSSLFVPDSCFGFLSTVKKSDIILDGGNVVQYGEYAIISDIVFKHNPFYRTTTLLSQLSFLLDAEIIIVPHEPGDSLGHADAIVRFVDERTVLINDYSVMKDKKYREYSARLIKILNKSGLAVVLMPFGYHRAPRISERAFRKRFPDGDDFNPAFGYYINFLHAKGVVLVPRFGIDEDDEAASVICRTFNDCRVYTVDCHDLSMEGGLINCVTMNYQTR